ncbi:MAG: LPXTG cell wall anchor domain-containing protein [Methanosarcinales archaeon]|nr:LPXTG cell wall anchor domain-containing protein [Methanosarcinales archaeon]
MSGKTKIWIYSIVLLVLLLLFPVSAAEITYTFDLHTDGEAWYIIEYRTLLDSQVRMDEFNSFKLMVEGNNTYITEFEANMRSIVSEAGIATSRPMTASDFDVLVSVQNTATGNYGIVRSSFKWSHLAEVSGSSIMLGDVFFGGQYISNGDTFVVKVPDGYKVSGATPEPDVQRKDELIWNGPRTFNSGEPGVTFEKGTSWLLIAGILVVVGAGAFFLFKKKGDNGSNNASRPGKVIKAETSEPVMATHSQPSVSTDTGIGAGVGSGISSGTGLESDEDIIISMLKESGGAMMQSGIVKNSGFSKSKTSALLNKMAEDGLIQRVKKGRENLIRLA